MLWLDGGNLSQRRGAAQQESRNALTVSGLPASAICRFASIPTPTFLWDCGRLSCAWRREKSSRSLPITEIRSCCLLATRLCVLQQSLLIRNSRADKANSLRNTSHQAGSPLVTNKGHHPRVLASAPDFPAAARTAHPAGAGAKRQLQRPIACVADAALSVNRQRFCPVYGQIHGARTR